MKLEVYAIYDVRMACFAHPFFVQHEVQATRAFMTVANDSSTQVGQYPADFALFHLADFDDEKGEFMRVAHKNCGYAAEYRVKGGSNGEGEVAPTALGDEAHVRAGAEGTDSEEHVRPQSRS